MKAVGALLLFFWMSPAINFAQRSGLAVHSWAYQLQQIDINRIAENRTFDLIVMDYSQNGAAETKFSPADIARIQQSGKKALAYISIGEAENYRSYWKQGWSQSPPAWLGPENPRWPGNFKVRFWQPEWQNLVFDYIKDIYSQGFDGVYCDIIDAYYYWKTEHPEEPNADSLMMQFLLNIRSLVTTLGTRNFYIVPQNGESILHEQNVSDDLRRKFFSAVDAIGVEDVFFNGGMDMNNPYNPELARYPNLQEFLDNNKPVLSIEYLTDKNLIGTYQARAHEKGYIPYCNVRLLNALADGLSSQNAVNALEPQPNVTEYNSDGSITLMFPGNTCKHIALFDILGREVNASLEPSSAVRISKELIRSPAGTYFVKVVLREGTYFQKVVLP